MSNKPSAAAMRAAADITRYTRTFEPSSDELRRYTAEMIDAEIGAENQRLREALEHTARRADIARRNILGKHLALATGQLEDIEDRARAALEAKP